MKLVETIEPAHSLQQVAKQCLEQRSPAMLITVTATRGSAPRTSDTTMLVCADSIYGTIGGGHLEWQAISRARSLLTTGAADITDSQTLALGPSLGQCCGGTVSLSYQSLQASHLPALIAVEQPLFHLNLFGAGHVGQAVVSALAPVPCTIRWIDERNTIFPLAIPGRTTVQISDLPEAEVADAAPGDFYLVMTHSHARDLQIVTKVIERADAGYLGVIGSRTKRTRFERQLRQRGLNPAAMHCPIGQPALTGKEPWRIALAVAADLVNRVG